MEVMEEGNLLDRVQILLQRDLGYYNKHQTVLQETLCPGVVGGLLGKFHSLLNRSTMLNSDLYRRAYKLFY